MQTIKIIILSLPLLYELVKECYDFIVRGKEDDHKKSTLIRIGMLVVVSFGVAFFHDGYGYRLGVLQCFVFACGLYALFDPLMNLIRRYIGKQKHVHFFYYGSGAWTDGFMSKLPPHAQLFLRGWILAVAYMVYFQMDQILGLNTYGY